jgi:hypothetical protein
LGCCRGYSTRKISQSSIEILIQVNSTRWRWKKSIIPVVLGYVIHLMWPQTTACLFRLYAEWLWSSAHFSEAEIQTPQ